MTTTAWIREKKMARGETKVQQQAQQLGAQQQAWIDQQLGARQAAKPGITSGYNSLANWGSPPIENQYEQFATQPVSTAMDAASQQAANRLSRTRNAAGFGAEEENLAGQKAAQLGQAGQRGQLAYQDTQLQNRLAGLQGLSSLYGIDTNLLGRMMGLPAQTLGVQEQAAKPTNSIRFGPLGLSF
jgi:hypothetical protein